MNLSNTSHSFVILYLRLPIGLLGAFSIATGLFLSPVITAICRSKSTRLLAVIGGLIATLGCLFSSFAIQFHQIFFSYGKFNWLSSMKCRK